MRGAGLAFRDAAVRGDDDMGSFLVRLSAPASSFPGAGAAPTGVMLKTRIRSPGTPLARIAPAAPLPVRKPQSSSARTVGGPPNPPVAQLMPPRASRLITVTTRKGAKSGWWSPAGITHRTLLVIAPATARPFTSRAGWKWARAMNRSHVARSSSGSTAAVIVQRVGAPSAPTSSRKRTMPDAPR